MAFFALQAQCKIERMRGNAAVLPLCIHAVARPTVIRRMRHHARPHGIELDIAIAGQDIGFFLQQAGAKTSLPQRAAAPVSPIDVLHIALSQRLHQLAQAVGCSRRQQQMHMIGHQAPGMDGATMFFGLLAEMIQVEAVIFLGIKARRTVVAALDQMDRNIRQQNTGATRHGLPSESSRLSQ